MPIDYKKYPKNWRSEIRPAILERAKNCCEQCKARNGELILRGTKDGRRCFQYFGTAAIFDENTGEHFCDDYAGEVDDNGNYTCIKVVLTVAHIDHDITNNDPSNLRAWCQLHHLRHDKEQHVVNARMTRKNKMQQHILDI